MFQCTLCHRTFNKSTSLRRHTHSQHTGYRYPCPGCGILYRRREYIKKHSRKCPGKSVIVPTPMATECQETKAKHHRYLGSCHHVPDANIPGHLSNPGLVSGSGLPGLVGGPTAATTGITWKDRNREKNVDIKVAIPSTVWMDILHPVYVKILCSVTMCAIY